MSIDYKERAEMYRRQLGGTNAALNRSRQRNKDLEKLVREMYLYVTSAGMELCDACTLADGEFSDCNSIDVYDGACGIAMRRFEELYADDIEKLGVKA